MRWTNLIAEYGHRTRSFRSSEGHSLHAVCGGEYVLKFGGRGADGCGDDMSMFDIRKLSWEVLNQSGPQPVPRTGHGSAVMGGGTRMMMFGGASRWGRLNDTSLFDIEKRHWIPVSLSTPVVPSPRARMTLSTIDDGTQALLFGGREGFRFLGDRYRNDLYLFDGCRWEWLTVTPRGSQCPQVRCSHIAAVINHRQLLVFGGLEDPVRHYGDTWLFDMNSGKWVLLPYPDLNPPQARQAHSCALLDSQLYVYGGENEAGAYLNDVHTFDCNTLQWKGKQETIGRSPGGRSGAGMTAIGPNMAMVCGGDTGFAYSDETFLLGVSEITLSHCQQIVAAKRRGLKCREEETLCAICLDRTVEVIFLWCTHCCCCKACGTRLSACPWCRSPISRMESITS